MIYDDFARQILLAATGGIFIAFATWAVAAPRSMANSLGYRLDSSNAMSEFHAIYLGVFVAQALLCLLAFVRIDDALIGDLVAVFLLAQPIGRAVAGLRGAWPTGLLRLAMVLELFGGLAILFVRPAV